MIKNILKASLSGLFTLIGLTLFAQESRTQYSPLLSNSYYGANIGYINYPFSGAQMEKGNTVASVHVPHAAVKLVLFGKEFNRYLSAQITYMRPVSWITYRNVNGDGQDHSVWMNVGGLTLKSQLPLANQVSLYGEGGLAIITRRGFQINNVAVVKNANYASVQLGGGLQYHINHKWSLAAGVTYSPASGKYKQPGTVFYSAGFNYYMRHLTEARLEQVAKAGYIFPKNLIQIGFTTNRFGYEVNDFVSGKALPIFWGGDVHIEKGITGHFQHNIFHTRKVFSLDLGASFSYYKAVNNDRFYALSIYPLLRFTALHTKPADLYFNYSVAGPSFISRVLFGDIDTGKKFTFQDFMGMGIYTGKHRNINAEIRIAHYSNGDLFPENAGIKVPLTFTLGYAF